VLYFQEVEQLARTRSPNGITKRSRQSSVASRRSRSRSLSSEPTAKKTRRGSDSSDTSPHDQLAMQMSIAGLDERMPSSSSHVQHVSPYHGLPTLPTTEAQRPSSKRQSPDNLITERKIAPMITQRRPSVDCVDSPYATSPATTLTSSFGSIGGEYCGPYQTKPTTQAPTGFPGKQDYAFSPNGPAHHDMRVYQAHDIPHPSFNTVPNTPIFSPTHVMHPVAAREIESAGYARRAQPERAIGSVTQLDERGYPCAPQAPSGPAYPMIPPAVSGQYSTPPLQQQPFQGYYHGAPMTGQPNPGYYGATAYQHIQPQPRNDDGTFYYPEAMPDPDFQAPALPGSVIRGFTGHSSGVGE
jgi:hypothetical protein